MIIFLCVLLLICCAYLYLLFFYNRTRSFLRVNLLKQEVTHSIDVVVTWVDTHDTKWSKLKQQFLKNYSDNHPSRWADKLSKPDTELEYCLLSICKHLPYVRRIFVVTMRPQSPPCVSINKQLHNEFQKERIRVVHHDEVFTDPWKNKITFNSKCIESFLHNIPGLAEHFLYFNDDFYVNRYIAPQYLFQMNKPVFYGKLKSNRFRKRVLCNDYDKQECAMHKTINLVQDTWPSLFFRGWHQFQPLTKTIVEQTTQRFNPHIRTVRNNTFRQKNGVSVIQLCLNYALNTQQALLGRNRDLHEKCVDTLIIDIQHPETLLSSQIPHHVHTFCVNNCNSKKCQMALDAYFKERL